MMFNFYLTSVDLNGSQSDECGLFFKIIIIFNLSLHLLQNSDNRHLEIYLQVLNSFKLGMTFIRLFSLSAHNWI